MLESGLRAASCLFFDYVSELGLVGFTSSAMVVGGTTLRLEKVSHTRCLDA